MANAYENLVKHMQLAIRQLDQLTTVPNKSSVDSHELSYLYDLTDRLQSLVLDLTD